MIKMSLLGAASAAAFALASPASARPMTATDMHMMHRVGAPEVSADGKWAVFTISDTDLDALYRGLAEASEAYACPIVGGDLTNAPALVVTVAMLGSVDGYEWD